MAAVLSRRAGRAGVASPSLLHTISHPPHSWWRAAGAPASLLQVRECTHRSQLHPRRSFSSGKGLASSATATPPPAILFSTPPQVNHALSTPLQSMLQSPAESSNSFCTPRHNISAPILKILAAIRKRDTELTWQAYLDIRSSNSPPLPYDIYSQILLSLRPKQHLPRGKRGYFDTWNATYDPTTMIFPMAKTTTSEFSKKMFMDRVHTVLEEMKASGIPLQLPEYTHLLDCARATGNVDAAKELWGEMSLRGIHKDTKCYNTFLAAVCGTTLTQSTWKTELRTITLRQQKSKENISDFATKILHAMVSNGVRPDITTFDLALLAHSKMGNLQQVRSLVLKCWGVDIASDTLAPMESDTPPLNLRPVPQTLSNIAIGLSQVSKPAAALRLIGYLSRTYSMSVPHQTWNFLLTWVYTLSRPPAASRVIPDATLTEVWKIMTQEPYNIVPDMDMYDTIIRHHIHGQRFKLADAYIDKAIRGPYRALTSEFNFKRGELESPVGIGKYPGAPPPSSIRNHHAGLIGRSSAAKEVAALDFQIYRARSIIKRWIELLIYGRSASEKEGKHRNTRLPLFIDKYRQEFIGHVIMYPTASGFVQLKTGREKFGSPIRRTKSNGPWRWMALGTRYGGKETREQVIEKSSGQSINALPVQSNHQTLRQKWEMVKQQAAMHRGAETPKQ